MGFSEVEHDERIAREIAIRFTYHAPTGDQPARYEAIRRAAAEMARLLARLCPESHEASLAMTRLDEVVFWANASIARRSNGG